MSGSFSGFSKKDREVLELFKANCVSYPGNFEVTPGQALYIAERLLHPPKSASQKARDAFHAGDLKGALKIVSGWRPSKVATKAQLKVMSLGYECLVRPDFYRSLGRDVESCVAEAKRVFAVVLLKE